MVTSWFSSSEDCILSLLETSKHFSDIMNGFDINQSKLLITLNEDYDYQTDSWSFNNRPYLIILMYWLLSNLKLQTMHLVTPRNERKHTTNQPDFYFINMTKKCKKQPKKVEYIC